MKYAKTVILDLPYEQAVERVKDVFKQKGFGTLTEIDVQATLEEKLGVDVGRYLIIGACNPALARRALEAEIYVGLLLPCNVVVREAAEGAGVVVDALDPSLIASVSENPELRPVADEATALVDEALAVLAGGSNT